MAAERHVRARAALRLEPDARRSVTAASSSLTRTSASLERLGQEGDEIYHQNNKNFEPRLGFAWDPFKDGKTSVRGAYAILVDQPITSVVAGTSGNPPLGHTAHLHRLDQLGECDRPGSGPPGWRRRP